jgi:hypothetical protein
VGSFFASVRPRAGAILPIAELFGQCDHNALGAAEVTESVHVLVLRNFANKFGPVLLQASNDVSMSVTANMMRRMPSVFTGIFGSVLIAVGF